MTTALDTLKRSLRMLGVYATGEEPRAQEASDGLAAFNALIGTMSNGGMVYAKSLDSISIAAGTSSITVGPSGGTVTTRPVQVLDDSYVLIDTVSYPLKELTLQQYNDLGLKTVQGIPRFFWVQPSMPNITVTLWPVPDQAMTLKLWSSKPLSSALSLTTELSFPPGYEDAFAYLLAEALAPEYAVSLTSEMLRGVGRSRRLLKRTNLEVPKLSMPNAVLGNPVFLDIREL